MVFEHGRPWARNKSNFIKILIDYSLLAVNIMTGCVYIVFIANTFGEIFNGLFDWTLSVRIYILFTIIPIMLIGHVRYLKYLVPTSGLANILILVTIGIVIYYIFEQPLVMSDKPLVAPFNKWAIFLT